MPSRSLHLLPSSAPCGARSWLIEELNRATHSPNDAVYAASLAGQREPGERMGQDQVAIQWLEFARRPRDPLRWWRFYRWLNQAQPRTIRFWDAPELWLRRLVRFASPGSRWQVLFRSRGELPTTYDRTWAALETAWFDNPLLLERAGSALAHAGKKLLEWPRATSTQLKGGDDKARLLARLGLPPETILLVTVGPLVREKNQEQLFWSLDQLSCTRDDVRLLIIGDGPDRARLEHHARLHHVAQRIVWLGTVDSPAEYLRAADLYVSADPRERVSRAMLEAHAAGLPIIAHDTATNRQIVTSPEQGKLVDPTYLADYAGTMYRWLNAKAAQTS